MKFNITLMLAVLAVASFQNVSAMQGPTYRGRKSGKETSYTRDQARRFRSLIFARKWSDAETKELQELLNSGANVNTQDHDGLTLLHGAAFDGQVVLCSMLLNAGANVNVKGRELEYRGFTPLHAAVCNGQVALCSMLLDAGAQMSVQDANGNTPLKRALNAIDFKDVPVSLLMLCNLREIVRMCIEKKATINGISTQILLKFLSVADQIEACMKDGSGPAEERDQASEVLEHLKELLVDLFFCPQFYLLN